MLASSARVLIFSVIFGLLTAHVASTETPEKPNSPEATSLSRTKMAVGCKNALADDCPGISV